MPALHYEGRTHSEHQTQTGLIDSKYHCSKSSFFSPFQSAFWHTFHSGYPEAAVQCQAMLMGAKEWLFVECVKDSRARERESSCITFHAFSSVPPFFAGGTYARPGCGGRGFPSAQATLRVPLSVPLPPGQKQLQYRGFHPSSFLWCLLTGWLPLSCLSLRLIVL